MASKQVKPGTVIHGTLRSEDLIPAFFSELLAYDPDAAAVILDNFPDYLGDEPDPNCYLSEDTNWLFDKLFDALNDVAPKGHYFGAHPGDGSDFGFWPR